jgi:DNA-binding MarR family transcriptional regulator
VFQDFVRTLAPLQIRPAQYSVLVVIESNPGLSQAEIAERLGIERARLARMLDRLEWRGFTRRQAAPNDRRSHALFLTREGQRTLRKVKALAARHEAQLMEWLGAEKHKLLLNALKEYGRLKPLNGGRIQRD